MEPTFDWYVTEFTRLGQTKFLVRYTNPFLSVDVPAKKKSRTGVALTRHISRDALQKRKGQKGLYEVKPSGKSALAMYVSVGRAPNCDIRLNYSEISSIHALFQEQDGQWMVCDRSSNGIWLQGSQLEREAWVNVQSGDRLKFSKLEAQFLDAPRLCDLLMNYARG